MSNLKNFYKTLGKKTRLIIKCTLLFSVTLSLLGIFSYYAESSPNHYRLLLITDELFTSARSFLTIGLFGALFFNYIEKKSGGC